MAKTLPEAKTGMVADALDVTAAIAAVSAPDCGGVAAFVGTVRLTPTAPSGEGKEVVALEYEAHPTLADDRLRDIAVEAGRRWDVRRVIALHRTGRCSLGEPTVVIACGAPHRAAALEACRWMIDTIKQTVPVWKQEVYADGSAWVGPGA